jgi:transposase-like protein
MRYPASEKLEIIRIVEQSHLPVRRTLKQLAIPRATFYRWYDLLQTGGPDALEDRQPRPGRVWNRIPAEVRSRLIDLALNEPELSPRELAVRFTETESYFVSEALRLPPAQGPRPDHQSGVHRRQGCRRVQGQDHGTQPAVADRLHLSQGDRLGLVLSVHRAR